MGPEVQKAIDAIREQFGHDLVLAADDRDGGGYVIVEGVPMGMPFSQEESWVGFHIPSTCPYADVYPHFVRADLMRSDGKPLGDGLSNGHRFPDPNGLTASGVMPARSSVQISRRSNRRDTADLETPLLKLLKVIRWLKSR